jgi:hypothetical protein
MSILENALLGRSSGFSPTTATGLQGGTRGTLPENAEIAADGTIKMRLPDGRLIDPFTTGFSTGITPGFGGGYTAPSFTTTTPTPGAGVDITNLPALRTSSVTDSNIDPTLRPYLELGLRRGEELFFGPGPQFYPGQTYISPSQPLLDALSAREAAARAAPSAITAGGDAYSSALASTARTAGGEFLSGSPYLEDVIGRATRPITERLTEQTLPAIASGFSSAGRYGSGAMQRSTSGATEAASKAIGDVASNIAYGDYARERGLMETAAGRMGVLAGMAPSIYEAGFLPSAKLAEVGQARMRLDQPALDEAMRRFEFEQNQPYMNLSNFLSSVYGTPMASDYMPPTRTDDTTRYLSYLSTIAGSFPETREAVERGILSLID